MITNQFIVGQTMDFQKYTNCTVLCSTINIPNSGKLEFIDCKLFYVNIVKRAGTSDGYISRNNTWSLFSDFPKDYTMQTGRDSCIFGSRESLKTLLLLGKPLLLLGGLCLLCYKVSPILNSYLL